jgi:hypothetical protein
MHSAGLTEKLHSRLQSKALKSFNLDVFKNMLQGTRQRSSTALSAGIQGVATAKREIKRVEALKAVEANSHMHPQNLMAMNVEAKLHSDETAYDETNTELEKAQRAMNLRSLAMLQHHQLEKALEMHKKGRETDADFARNIAWDKKDMVTTKAMQAKVDQLSKQAAAEQKTLNADTVAMLSLEEANTKKRVAAQQRSVGRQVAPAKAAKKQRALAHLASKAAVAAQTSAVSYLAAPKAAAMPPAAAAMKSAKTAALSSAASRQGAGVAHGQAVPQACIALSVVKGAVQVPKHCLQFAMVKQVLGEAKRRGGVKFIVTP